MENKYKYKYYKYKLKYAHIKNTYKNNSYHYILSGGYNENDEEDENVENEIEDEIEENENDDDEIEDEDEEPTETPVEEPTETPVEEPTETPVEGPTETPVEGPTETPVEEPTETPVKEPTETPVKEPTETPEEPTETPVEQIKTIKDLSNNVFLPNKNPIVIPVKDDEYNYDLIPDYIKTISKYINEIETIISQLRPDTTSCTTEECNQVLSFSSKDTKILNKLIDKISNYISHNDIPINFNLYDINHLQKALEQLKTKLQLEKITKLYKIRYKLFNINNPTLALDKTQLYKPFDTSKPLSVSIEEKQKPKEKTYDKPYPLVKKYLNFFPNESNMNYVLDYAISYYKISNIQDVEKLFTSSLMGYNKNYLFYYMILLRWLTVNNKYLYVLKEKVSVLSYNSLYSYLNENINMDEYIPFIIILMNRYINHFKFDKPLEIKSYTTYEKLSKKTTNAEYHSEDDGIVLTHYDSKNSALLYDYDIMKFASQITFNDIIAILYNLFRTKLIYHL